MSLFEKLAGTIRSFFQFGGPNGAGLNNVNPGGPALEVKDSTNTALVVMRGADPVGPTDFVTQQFATLNYQDVLVYRPGAATPPPAKVAATWAALMALFAETTGPVLIVVDTSLGAANVPVGVFDMQSRVTFTGEAAARSFFSPPVLNIVDGGQLVNVSGFDAIELHGNGTVLPGLAFTAGGATGNSTVQVSRGSTLGAYAAAPLISMPGTGYTLIFCLQYESSLGIGNPNFIHVNATDTFYVLAFTGSEVASDCITAVPTSALSFFYDSSCVFATQINDASTTWLHGGRTPVGTIGSSLVYRPGATGFIPGNVAIDWLDLMNLFSLTSGPVEIAVDTSVGPVNILPIGPYDFQERATFVAALGSVTAPPLFDIPDGVQLLNFSGFVGDMEVRGQGLAAGSGLNPWVFSIDGQAVELADGVQITNAGDLPLFSQVGTQVYLTMRGRNTNINDNVIFADSPGGGSINIFLPDWAYLGVNTLTAAAGGVSIRRNPIAFFTPQNNIVVPYNEQVFGTPGSLLVYRPGALGAVDGNVAPTWERLMLLFAATAGPVTIAIDTSLASTVQPPGVYDFEGRATFVPWHTSAAFPNTIVLDVSDAAQLANVSGFVGNYSVRGHATGVNPLPLAFTAGGAGGASRLEISDGCEVVSLSGRPMLDLGGGGYTLSLQMRRGNIPSFGIWALVGAGDSLLVEAADDSIFAANVLTVNAAGTANITHDTSVQFNAQAGDASGTWSDNLQNAGISKNNAMLVLGVTPFISIPWLTSNSVITFGLRVDAGGAATTRYAALQADRVFGAAGGFKLTALAGAAVNAADGSTLDWMVTLAP